MATTQANVDQCARITLKEASGEREVYHSVTMLIGHERIVMDTVTTKADG